MTSARHADAQHHLLQPFGGARHIFGVLRLCADRLNAEQMFVFFEEAFLICLGEFVRIVHILPL